jgi:hypothetical protein
MFAIATAPAFNIETCSKGGQSAFQSFSVGLHPQRWAFQPFVQYFIQPNGTVQSNATILGFTYAVASKSLPPDAIRVPAGDLPWNPWIAFSSVVLEAGDRGRAQGGRTSTNLFTSEQQAAARIGPSTRRLSFARVTHPAS